MWVEKLDFKSFYVMKKLDLVQIEQLEGGASFIGCIGGSAFSVGLFVAGAALATTITAGAAAVAIVGLYGGIGFSCLT
jgi:hypothetical protein